MRRFPTMTCIYTIAVCFLSPLAVQTAHAELQYACRELSPENMEQLTDRPAVVADIDGTMTGYINQDYVSTDGTAIEAGVGYARVDAALMMNIYNRRGYVIVYLAGRPRQMEVLGKTMCQSTVDWLHDNGFPIEQDTALVLLHDADQETLDAKNPGQAMAEMMGKVGTDLFVAMITDAKQAIGLDPQYGYSDSDQVVDAFIEVGVAPEKNFTIGNEGISKLGYRGSQPIIGPGLNPGYTAHVKDYVIPNVPEAK
ncbi:hypothetical protein [Roseibium sp. RKSG952]|uniref:LNS2 domain-containing protein n=1 Tax=Roseibium sp. RKSG952 TaxID=2529384 RepID=UPI0012BD5DCB|nr:hypothetical protein [Roseibium sp. RKSG952]MTH97017.1 hypothetical protein [Roseibium sp. RKSG952]